MSNYRLMTAESRLIDILKDLNDVSDLLDFNHPIDRSMIRTIYDVERRLELILGYLKGRNISSIIPDEDEDISVEENPADDPNDDPELDIDTEENPTNRF